MPGSTLQLAVLVVIVGGVIVVSLISKSVCERIRLPPLLAYLLIGFALRGGEEAWSLLPEGADQVFDFLAKLGVIALLFTVGLKSRLNELLGQLRRASLIWVGNIVISGGLGYFAARWLGLEVIPSIIIGVAMTATSVGVPSAVWERTDTVGTEDGELFVDVAELDDISGVVLLAILFAVLPALREALGDTSATGGGGEDGLLGPLLATGGLVLGKLVVFSGACYLFARFARERVVRFFERRESDTDAVISLASIGIIIAGVAGVLGFSVAIGAFFAGLAFSQNRESIETRTPYQTLRDLFVPFFFVGIGLSVSPSAVMGSWVLAGGLVAVAIVGKVVGTTGPALAVTGASSALVLGVAMVPRAEITMIIMHRGLKLGDWAVTPAIFSAMVVVVLVSCLIAPPTLRYLIERFVQPKGEPS